MSLFIDYVQLSYPNLSNLFVTPKFKTELTNENIRTRTVSLRIKRIHALFCYGLGWCIVHKLITIDNNKKFTIP